MPCDFETHYFLQWVNIGVLATKRFKMQRFET
jgi:hypothetical protein